MDIYLADLERESAENYPTTVARADAFLVRVATHLSDKCSLLGTVADFPRANRAYRAYNTAFHLVENIRQRTKEAA